MTSKPESHAHFDIFALGPPEPLESAPYRLALEIDGDRYREIDPRTGAVVESGPLARFKHAWKAAGSAGAGARLAG